MLLRPLPTVMLEPLVRAAVLEDLGRAGDLTTDAIVPRCLQTTTALVARQPGSSPGWTLAALAFRLIAPDIAMEVHKPDRSTLAAGEVMATVQGPAAGILTGERVALNFLCHLSGIASATASVVAALAGTGTRVTCTRKTMPGLRAVQKYAVRADCGSNHRLGLNDAVLIKGQPRLHRRGWSHRDHPRTVAGWPLGQDRGGSRHVGASRCWAHSGTVAPGEGATKFAIGQTARHAPASTASAVARVLRRSDVRFMGFLVDTPPIQMQRLRPCELRYANGWRPWTRVSTAGPAWPTARFLGAAWQDRAVAQSAGWVMASGKGRSC